MPTKQKDFYAILDVEPESTLKEITSAYRRLIVDCQGSDLKPTDEKRHNDIEEAYAMLEHPDIRKNYDKFRAEHPELIEDYQESSAQEKSGEKKLGVGAKLLTNPVVRWIATSSVTMGSALGAQHVNVDKTAPVEARASQENADRTSADSLQQEVGNQVDRLRAENSENQGRAR
jgi:curved DNA-binding protein CbpA